MIGKDHMTRGVAVLEAHGHIVGGCGRDVVLDPVGVAVTRCTCKLADCHNGCGHTYQRYRLPGCHMAALWGVAMWVWPYIPEV